MTYDASSSAVMFLSSIFLPIMMKTMKRKQQYSTRASIEIGYISTLKKILFPKKMPSRHDCKSNQLTVDEIFQSRKTFFQSVYEEYFLFSQNCHVIHVAGTKGKGSTVEYISAGLIESGKSVGIFTSPHIHTARERIKYCRKLISKEEFTRIGNSALELLQKFDWTVFFDILLTSSLIFFGEKKVNYLLLECGIGGRYDSTNFLDNPTVCVITSISLDHQSILGNKIEEIAWQKAGIIKKNSVVFTPATQKTNVLEVLRKQSMEMNATLHEVPINMINLQEWDIPTQCDVQTENACLSLAVLQYLNISPKGMKNFFWPCRMELFDFEDHHVILDGCHNGESVQLFLSELHKKYPNKIKHILFGAGKEKCVEDMLEILFDQADQVTLIQSKNFKSVSEQELWDKLQMNQLSKLVPYQQSLQPISNEGTSPAPVLDWLQEGTIESRLEWTLNHSSDNEVIAVCGSLFAAAEAREYLYRRLGPKYFSASDWVSERDMI